mmetsp:Transcript_81925/g.265409  ORF Transcript_81925/g.265409 Transcript_81925/m.265409 type:complete len:209 (+) Transcript_81925:1792-2418(+)
MASRTCTTRSPRASPRSCARRRPRVGSTSCRARPLGRCGRSTTCPSSSIRCRASPAVVRIGSTTRSAPSPCGARRTARYGRCPCCRRSRSLRSMPTPAASTPLGTLPWRQPLGRARRSLRQRPCARRALRCVRRRPPRWGGRLRRPRPWYPLRPQGTALRRFSTPHWGPPCGSRRRSVFRRLRGQAPPRDPELRPVPGGWAPAGPGLR